jgi:hypothetical protein
VSWDAGTLGRWDAGKLVSCHTPCQAGFAGESSGSAADHLQHETAPEILIDVEGLHNDFEEPGGLPARICHWQLGRLESSI